MAKAVKPIINALRKAAEKIAIDGHYQWGHMGACNCGYVAQEITHLSKGQIHDYAMKGYGDWTEQVMAFCPTSEFPMDLLISEMVAAGFSLEDLINLERLKDSEVLSRIPIEMRKSLKHNNQQDVILYLNSWADLLDEKIEKESRNKLAVF